MKRILLVAVVFAFFPLLSLAQSCYWQQRAQYTMEVQMNVATNRFTGIQTLVYYNHSPDTLKRVFYHLYWNAFQPNSSMDVHSREQGKIMVRGHADWDSRVQDRIAHLKPDETGYQKILSLKMNGVDQPFAYHETILEVLLTKPVAPDSHVTFTLSFEAQVPLQIRRSGRDNPKTGVRYSMSQWYPKMCEYDEEGWHPTPYVAREFYGVWGDYDVTIHIDKAYKLGATGILENAADIGWGYDSAATPGLKKTREKERTWHFVAKNVHDFVWAADPDYIHLVRPISGNGPVLHVLYKFRKDSASNDAAWKHLADAAVEVLPFIERQFGPYPYPQYSFIQGGDGGMEYPMATLLAGPGLDGAFHEWMHSWFQMMLATNESMYPWMDEGFTSYAENLVTAYYNHYPQLEEYKALEKENPDNERLKELIAVLPENHSDAYAGYFQLAASGLEEPLTTHADHFNTNYAYNLASYSKGEVFLEQLGYIVGAATRDSILRAYYYAWRFRHPNAGDFFRIAEKISDMKLDWYREYWCSTTKTIDYGIDTVMEDSLAAKIVLRRIGQIPMPVDVEITLQNGTKEMYYIPLNLMFGQKASEDPEEKRTVEEEWRWTHPVYELKIPHSFKEIIKVEIDPSKRMADVDRSNNSSVIK